VDSRRASGWIYGGGGYLISKRKVACSSGENRGGKSDGGKSRRCLEKVTWPLGPTAFRCRTNPIAGVSDRGQLLDDTNPPAPKEWALFPIAPSFTFRFQCFQQDGEPAFRSKANPSRVNRSSFGTVLPQFGRCVANRELTRGSTLCATKHILLMSTILVIRA